MPANILSRPLSKLNFRNMGEFTYKEQYGVIVMCQNEEEQKSIYEWLVKNGLKVKVVSV
jgi:predicted 3-demethylubiquinone-9 3-methyltransferase (glyoxalase superfamily)